MTIDGPSGSGKGTVSRAAARALGWALLDSGALYRLVALAGRKAGVRLDDGPGLARLAGGIDIRFESDPAGEEVVWLDGQEVTGAIRTEGAGNDASKVASLPVVRTALLERQRRFAVPPGLAARPTTNSAADRPPMPIAGVEALFGRCALHTAASRQRSSRLWGLVSKIDR